MASSNRLLTLDIGSHNLKLAEFIVDSRAGLTLVDYAIEDLGMDPNKEQARFPFVVEGLKKLMAQKKFRAKECYASVSGQFVFTRFVKLPQVEAGQLSQIVGFEAQQNVPFPIEEVVWDYQLLGGGLQAEYEAVIVAMKVDLVEESATALATQKTNLELVDVAPLALVNSYRYNYPDINDCTLIVDMGAKTTNLIFVEKSKAFSRVIPIAGHQISQNISNEFQEPYNAAETLKKGKGFVGLGGAYADPDDQMAASISKIARSVMSRLHAEVSRSINFYKNQQGGSSPRYILLTGGTSSLPYTDLFFHEKLQIPVETFNPLRSVNIAPQITKERLAKDITMMGVTVGLALRKLENCPVEVDLSPPSVRKAQEVRHRAPYLAMGTIFMIVIFASAIFANWWQAVKEEEFVKKFQGDLTQRRTLSNQIKEIQGQIESERKSLENFKRIQWQHRFWPELLTSIEEKMPTGLWIDKMQILSNGSHVKNKVPARGQTSSSAPRRGRQAEQTVAEVYNLSEQADQILITGYVESGVRSDTLDVFVGKLSELPFLKEKSNDFRLDPAQIVSRYDDMDDQVATPYEIMLHLDTSKIPDLKP